MNNKFILDACCGCRMMWLNKNHPNCLYMDIRKEDKDFIKEKGIVKGHWEVNPDVIGDFTNLPEEIKKRKFKLIVWDVPHFKARKLSGTLLKKFGALNPKTWQSDLTNGFKELWSVLEDYGILIFKFSDYHIKFKEVLSLFPEQPLFFNRMNSTNIDKGKSQTRWFCFMKIPEQELLNSLGEKEQCSS